MAIKYWFGLVPGSEFDYSVANNWVPANVPVANDDVVIGLTNASILYGLDQSAVELDTFEVLDGYTGTIGAVYHPLVIEAAEKVILRGSGDVHLDLTTGPTAYMKAERTSGESGVYYLNADEVTDFDITRGSVVYTGVAGSVRLTHISDLANDSHLVFQGSAGTGIESCKVFGGLYEMKDNITGASGGFLEVYEGTAIVYNGAATGAKLWGGGTLDWRSTIDPGSITAMGSGTLTFANDQRAKTITTVNLWGSPTLNLDNGAGNITITNIKTIGLPTIIPTGGKQTVTIA